VRLSSDQAWQRARWEGGVRNAVASYLELLGPVASPSLTVADVPGVRAADAARAQASTVPVTAPLWSSWRGTAVETAIAQAIGDRLWRETLPCAAGDWFVDGLTRYTATSSVAAQFDPTGIPPSVGLLEARYFGGFIPWVLPVRREAATAGNGLSDYRAALDVNPVRAGSERDRRALAAKTALSLATMSNWFGRPTWDLVIRELVGRTRGRCASWADLNRVADDVTGGDLSWFFRPVFASTGVFDYGVDEISSQIEPGSRDQYRTTVVVRRYGDAQFTGTADPPIGPFESGRGVEVQVRFADGAMRTEYWDGRAASRRFVYDGPAAAISALVDPRQVLALDVDRSNNSRTVAPPARAVTAAWAARWAFWLQDLLLSYAALV